MCIRFVSFAYFITMWGLVLAYGETALSRPNPDPPEMGFADRDSTTKHDRSEPWSAERAAHFFSYMPLFYLNMALHIFASTFWMPLHPVGFFTDAGQRTLGCYLVGPWAARGIHACLSQILTWSSSEAEAVTQLVNSLGPAGHRVYLFVLTTFITLLCCSSAFQYSLTPLISPQWVIPLFDPTKNFKVSELIPAGPTLVPVRFQWLAWLVAFLVRPSLDTNKAPVVPDSGPKRITSTKTTSRNCAGLLSAPCS